jgi:hypothetical protein
MTIIPGSTSLLDLGQLNARAGCSSIDMSAAPLPVRSVVALHLKLRVDTIQHIIPH